MIRRDLHLICAGNDILSLPGKSRLNEFKIGKIILLMAIWS